MNRKIFLIFLLLPLPFCTLAAEHNVTETDLSAYKELSQARTEVLKESLQKDIQAQMVHIEAQDKLIDRQDKLLDSFSARISDLSIFLTVAGLVIGLLGYFTVTNRAKNEARLAAAEWIEKEGQKSIDEKLKELSPYITAMRDAVSAKSAEAMDAIEKLRANAAGQITEQQRQISASQKFMDGTTNEPIPSSNSDAITQLVEALKHKPEAEYGFDDWNARALDVYTKKNYPLAAEFWLQAARGGKSNAAQVAQSLFNAGVSLGQTNRLEEAIAVYSDVVSRYGSAPEEALRVLVANALVNKGVVLSQLGRREEAIAVYSDVVSRYGSAPEEALRVQVANALASKGGVLGLLERWEDAIAMCDDVVLRYGSAHEVAFRESVACALNGKGFALVCRGKANWDDEQRRLEDLQAAVPLFIQSEKDSDNKPVVCGNQAYTTFLLGQTEAARPLLERALQQGGETLYRATLDDLNIHTVPPDTAFSTLLKEIWAEVKAKA